MPIAEAYLADQIDTKNEANRRATEWLEQRLAELRRNLQVAEEAVASYRRDKGLAGSPEGAVSTQTLSDLNSKYVGARTKRIEREARLVALSRASLNPGEIANIAEVAGNTTLAALRIQDVELTRKMAELSSMLGDNHPKMVQARAELASVRARFLSETQRITLAVRAELDASKSEEDELKELVDKAAVVSGTASQYEAEQKQLEREAQSNRTLYESFLTRFKELREQQDIQRADARILAYAHPSGAPSSPNYKTGLMAAFVIGCLLGMAGAVAAEKLDRVFRSAAQVEEATGVGVLGMVPEVKGAAAQRSNVVAHVLENTTSPAAEAIRAVFTAISLGSLDRPPRVIAVTSSTPSEGKTTFVASLGGLLTKMNASRRVLIVDLDLRQARMSAALGLKDRGGTIDDYLMGLKTLEECTRRHDNSGVDYILRPAQHAERAGNPRIARHEGRAGHLLGALRPRDPRRPAGDGGVRRPHHRPPGRLHGVHRAVGQDAARGRQDRRQRPAGRQQPRRHRHQPRQPRQACPLRLRRPRRLLLALPRLLRHGRRDAGRRDAAAADLGETVGVAHASVLVTVVRTSVPAG